MEVLGQGLSLQALRFLVVFRGVVEPLLILATSSVSDEDASRFLGNGSGLLSLRIGLSFVAQGSLRAMLPKSRKGTRDVGFCHGGCCLILGA